MNRSYYSDSTAAFLSKSPEEVIGGLTQNAGDVAKTQSNAWREQIVILRDVLQGREGHVFFEYSIPRMGRRIDVVLIIGAVIFVLEFKAGDDTYQAYAMDQVWDYALDLKNFHESSHQEYIAPVLIATKAEYTNPVIAATPQNDKLLFPVQSNVETLGSVLDNVLVFTDGAEIEASHWESGRYCPTPTIIEAAMALYNNHSVADISRSDASAINLSQTSNAL
ncbi:hypothetical protein H8E50_13415, partial [bacterium]|nr:hypothetical protein [bacterium]